MSDAIDPDFARLVAKHGAVVASVVLDGADTLGVATCSGTPVRVSLCDVPTALFGWVIVRDPAAGPHASGLALDAATLRALATKAADLANTIDARASGGGRA